MRAPYQVLVFPFFQESDSISYCLFRRIDLGVWHGVAGGGEEGEAPLEAAKREAFEEAGIQDMHEIVQLASVSSIPVVAISGFIWGLDTPVVPEYTFGIMLNDRRIHLSDEHSAYEWCDFTKAYSRLHWDSNRTALWELNYRRCNRPSGV
jgi:dATP pyrophosphohydrolase